MKEMAAIILILVFFAAVFEGVDFWVDGKKHTFSLRSPKP